MTSRAALLGGAKEDLEVELSEYEQDSGLLTEGELLVRSDTLRKRVLRLDESRQILLNALCGGGPLERAHTLNQRVRCLDESRHILRPRGRACTARARQQASRRVREARAWWRGARGGRGDEVYVKTRKGGGRPRAQFSEYVNLHKRRDSWFGFAADGRPMSCADSARP